MLGDTLYLENLHEFVQDESKIVSYKWLSRKMNVPADAAKQMLYAYVEHCQSSTPENAITAIYTITGLIDTENGKSQQVCLVRGDDLEDTKKKFDHVRSVHIYSVQRTKIKDSSILFTADYDICKEHISTYSRWSPIGCPTPTESHPRPPSSTPPVTTSSSHTGRDTLAGRGSGGASSKACHQFPKLSCMKEGGQEVKEGTREGGESGNIGEVRTEDSATADAEKKVAKPSLRKTEAKKGSGKQQKRIVRGSVASFFSKQTATVKKQASPAVESATASSSTGPVKTEGCTEPQSSPVRGGKNRRDKFKSSPIKARSKSSPETSKVLIQSSVRKTGGLLNDSDIDDGSDSSEGPPQKQPTTSNKARTKRGTKSSGRGTEQRKRKQIQNMSSDEEENSGVKDVERDGSGSVTSVSATGRRRKRVKRLKSKMYTTEDGAMVTEKVWESESTDASDSDTKTHDRGGGGAKGSLKLEQPSPARGTKQSLLVNFFKK